MKKEELTLEFIYNLVFSLAEQLDWRDYSVTLFWDVYPAAKSLIAKTKKFNDSEIATTGGMVFADPSIGKLVELYAGGIQKLVLLGMKVRSLEEIDNERLRKWISRIILHEYRHTLQYDWMLENGISYYAAGENEAKYLYGEGPMESDANLFAAGKYVKPFEELFIDLLL